MLWRCRRLAPCPGHRQDGEVQDLAPGIVLGHYKLLRRLGQGGMGVVWEAVDQKLGRHVAVKLLIDAGREDSWALERFWREARTASSLNHPGICTIHELNESAESPFIVMELLEGSSLDKLYRGHPMPYARLVELGIQVADALDAAHRKGVLHRDIKPANIFLTNSGQAKILDFGLAKLDHATRIAAGAGIDAAAPTAAGSLTSSGSAVGTVAYMSPEQARGEPLDQRSDLFSFGIVLYEMATGQHPFTGTTTAVVFDRILNRPPVAPVTLNAELPPEFEGILNKALEKDRELRCQSAAEIRADLKRILRRGSSGTIPSAVSSDSDPGRIGQHPSGSSPWAPSPVPSSGSSARPLPSGVSVPREPIQGAPWRYRTAAIVGATAVALALGALGAWSFWPKPRPFVSIAVNQITNLGTIERVAISSDGRLLAEVRSEKGQRSVWIRNIATNTDTQILGPVASEYVGLTFSPDGNYLYFTRGAPENNTLRDLFIMPVFGGTPKQLIVDIDSAISFSPDGSRFAYVKWTPGQKDQYSEIHTSGKDGNGDQVVFATPELAEPPVWSPDGTRLAWLGSVNETTTIALSSIDLESKKLTTVPAPPGISLLGGGNGYTSLAWLPDNRHLLTLYSKPHSDRAQIGILAVPSGEFRSLTNDVNDYSQLALSANGRTLATVLTDVDSTVAYYKPDGGAPISTSPLRVTPSSIGWIDENRLLFIVRDIGLGSIDVATDGHQTFDTGDIDVGAHAAACPDGHIVFNGVPKVGGERVLFRMNADGGGIAPLTNIGVARSLACSLDSQQVYYAARVAREGSLWSIPLAGGTPKQLLPTDTISSAFVSRDARLAAFTSAGEVKTRATITDLVNHFILPPVLLDESDEAPPYMRFSLDNRALVYSVVRNGGHTLLYQPIDGSPSHILFDPGTETIRDFAWSPSGKELAVTRLKLSSDVVLITDQPDKGRN